MRQVYEVGAGELGIVCGMYLLFAGYAVMVRFSDDSGNNKTHTYGFDYYDALESFYECGKAA